MKIKEAINNGIRRVFDPSWHEKNAYILLPEMKEGKIGPWAFFYSRDEQACIGCQTPQQILMIMVDGFLDSEVSEYTGKIDQDDRE